MVRFNGINYTTWAFRFQLYLQAKELWGHIFGSDPTPTKDEKLISTWHTQDAKIKTWILGSVEPTLILNLKSYKTTKGMWEFFKKVYHQGTLARQFRLEFDIAQ